MVGRNLEPAFPHRANSARDVKVVLEAQRAHPAGHRARRSALQCGAGEVLGICGLMGAGRSELARILFGLDPCARGEVLLNGGDIAPPGPAARIRQGLAFLTENRREEGLCLEAAIADNMALVSLRRHAGRGFWACSTAPGCAAPWPVFARPCG